MFRFREGEEEEKGKAVMFYGKLEKRKVTGVLFQGKWKERKRGSLL